MTTQKIAQIILLLAALVIGVTAPALNGQTLLSLMLLGGVLLIAHNGRARVVPAEAESGQ
ncbi:hypothetical protein [Arthrobacter sp. MDT1-65]